MNKHQKTARALIEKQMSGEATAPIIEKTRRQVIAPAMAEVSDAWDDYVDAQRALLAAADAVVAVSEDEDFPPNLTQWMSRAAWKLRSTMVDAEKSARAGVSQLTDI